MRILGLALGLGASICACSSLPPAASRQGLQSDAAARSQPPFSFSTTENVASNSPMPIPRAGGFNGTVTFVARPSATIQPGAQVTQTLQNVALSGAPGGASVYYGLLFDAAQTSTVGLSVHAKQLPDRSAKYYLALYDPQRKTLGWQRAYAGPATANGNAVTFKGPLYAFNRYEQYWFAVYALAASAPRPTPAPSVTISPSPSPTPTTIASIQNLLSQTNSCSGTPCATGPTSPPIPAGRYLVETGLTKPSLDGSTTLLEIFPPREGISDVLYFTPPLAVAPLATQATWSFAYYLPQPVYNENGLSKMIALEFDFNVGMPNYTYNFSSQCLFAKSGPTGIPSAKWQIWNKGWTDAGFDCTAAEFTPLKWHHAKWMYSWNPATLTTHYISLTIDNKTYTPAPASPAPVQIRKQARSFLEVQFQQDIYPNPSPSSGVYPPGGFREFVDQVSLTFS